MNASDEGRPAPPEDSGGVQSLETGLRLLRALAEPGPPRMLKALAEAAGMPPSKAHRYLVSLARAGFAEREAGSGRHRLGPASLALGLAALAQSDPVRAGTEALAPLRDAVGETVALAVWGSAGPTFVRLEEAGRAVTVNARAGTVLPVLRSATGRVFGAFLPAAVIGPWIAREFATPGPGVPRDSAGVAALFAQVRASGLGRVAGELLAGIHALSAPVLDHEGRIVAALTALGPAGAFDDAPTGPVAAALRSSARRVSASLGFAGPWPGDDTTEATP